MAEGAISTLLAPLIQPLILDNFKLLSGVRSEIDLIRYEFEQMIAFLQVAGAHEDDDLQFEAWVKQVRDTAYDTEDILGQFMLRLGNRRSGRFSWFYKTYGFMKTITVRHQIASEVETIKSKVIAISGTRQRYQHYNVVEASNIVYTRRDTRRHDDPLLLRKNELVGIAKHKSELIKLLVDETNHKLQVVSVLGTGGLGKTTLVKKVFDDAEIVKHFEAHAWIIVSKSFQTKELLKELIKQLFAELKKDVPVEVEQMDQNGLKIFISGFLQSKRYVIVLDDVWTKDGWDALKYAFPDNDRSSRVIFTTRELHVASIGNVYELSLLTEEESWILFCEKAFQGKSCPQGLEEITKKNPKEMWWIAACCCGHWWSFSYQGPENR